MLMTPEVEELCVRIMRSQTQHHLEQEDFKALCEAVHVSKMYYRMSLGAGRFRDPRNDKLMIADEQEDKTIILFDNGRKTDLKLEYTYQFDVADNVYSYIEFEEGIRREDLDMDLYQFLADVVYILVSRQNMRKMLDFAESTDIQSGIPNYHFLRSRYIEYMNDYPVSDLYVCYINLQNFKYINRVGGPRCGNEAIVQYSRKLARLVAEEDCVCRMGGDNYVLFVHKENFDALMKALLNVTISGLETAPKQVFEISAWVGVSDMQEGEEKSFSVRVEEAATACNLGKTLLKKNIVFYTKKLEEMMGRDKEIIALFHPALESHEFFPHFQPKVDMRTGKLAGFEALCRWMHDGRYIYPDQFIPVLDRENFIPLLDMEIYRQSCAAIKRWKEMGLVPPRISVNFSRKNLFVNGIEDRISGVIREFGLEPADIEVEITESVKEDEYNRLIEFVQILKERGIRISVDDFGTGYSSLSLIHNIDADVIKIDKSFVDELGENERSEILVDNIIGIAKKLGMSLIAEGVETKEQGRHLLKLGCDYAQGYYYSKPVDFETATEMIRTPSFEAI